MLHFDYMSNVSAILKRGININDYKLDMQHIYLRIYHVIKTVENPVIPRLLSHNQK